MGCGLGCGPRRTIRSGCVLDNWAFVLPANDYRPTGPKRSPAFVAPARCPRSAVP